MRAEPIRRSTPEWRVTDPRSEARLADSSRAAAAVDWWTRSTRAASRVARSSTVSSVAAVSAGKPRIPMRKTSTAISASTKAAPSIAAVGTTSVSTS